MKIPWFNRAFIYKSLNQLLNTNGCKDGHRFGFLPSVRTKGLINRIRKEIIRYINPQFPANKMLVEVNVSCRSMLVVINEDLDFRPYTKNKVQILISAQISKKLQSCKKLLNRHCSKCLERLIFSDEKLFCTM